MSYVELQVSTHFSFLRGASSPDELFAAAALLGLPALGVTDRNSLAGMVRAHVAAKVTGVRLIVGCRIDLRCGARILVYPTDKAAYSNLCRLLSLGKARAGKGACDLGWDDIAAWCDGLIGVLVPDTPDDRTRDDLTRLRFLFGDRAYLALTLRRRPGDGKRLLALSQMAAALRVPTVGTGDVLYHSQERRMLQDVVTCIREKCTIDTLGHRRERNADRALKSGAEMLHRFRRYLGDESPVHRIAEIAARCTFNLDDLQYQYPEETHIPGLTEQEALERLTWEAAEARYTDGVPEHVTERLTYELGLIGKMDYARYFLTVNRIVGWARSQGILCQGRGSAANSAVCYVLGITPLDPMLYSLLFDRFVSTERNEPPDIDVDFDHSRREEVIQWIFDTYGRDRAAMCATVSRYRARGAIREVGKALGFSEDVTAALSQQVSAWGRGVEEGDATALDFDVTDERLALAIELARQLVGTPRHLSQHPGGFVLTRDRLDTLAVIEPAAMDNRQVVEWDKDDIDVLKMMKVDVLGLGMLGCMRRAFDLLKRHKKGRQPAEIPTELHEVPKEDPATYAMIRKADTLGVFQIESRAQMSMLPRLRPKEFYDLVVQIAIVRPGPIQGDMVHPYLRRREGKEPIEYPKEELRELLEKTCGVPLFQEQAMKIAMVCGNFTPAEADQLRRSMATFKTTGGVSHFKDKLVNGMVGRGYERDFAERLFKQIEGFGSYGFPESHAASFAILAYASSWVKWHHPDVFCCALLNAQPMGFYAPAQIVRDARDHGVEIRPVDINLSEWDSTLEECPASRGGFAVRMGLRFAKGLKEDQGKRVPLARPDTPYSSIEDLTWRSGLNAHSLTALAQADAFGSLGLTRRKALWEVRGHHDRPLTLFEATDVREAILRPEVVEPSVELMPMTRGASVVEDYHSLSLSLRSHPVAFLRSDLAALKARPCASLRQASDGQPAMIAGLVLVRQQPGTAKGVIFMTLEDESGIANVVIWQHVFQRFRPLILSARMIGVRGRVQRAGEVIHLVATGFVDLTRLLRTVGDRESDAPSGQAPRDRHPRGTINVPSRDFR